MSFWDSHLSTLLPAVLCRQDTANFSVVAASHACTASAVPWEPSPQPYTCYFYLVRICHFVVKCETRASYCRSQFIFTGSFFSLYPTTHVWFFNYISIDHILTVLSIWLNFFTVFCGVNNWFIFLSCLLSPVFVILTQLKTSELSQQRSKPWRNIMAVFSYGSLLGTDQLLLQWSWLSSECVWNIILENISFASSSQKMLLCLSQWVFSFLYHMTGYFLWLIPFISFLKS